MHLFGPLCMKNNTGYKKKNFLDKTHHSMFKYYIFIAGINSLSEHGYVDKCSLYLYLIATAIHIHVGPVIQVKMDYIQTCCRLQFAIHTQKDTHRHFRCGINYLNESSSLVGAITGSILAIEVMNGARSAIICLLLAHLYICLI